MFWVTDNFLMRHKRKTRQIATISLGDGDDDDDGGGAETTLFERVRVRYRSLHSGGKATATDGGDSGESDAIGCAAEEEEAFLMDRDVLATGGGSGSSPAMTAVMVSETQGAQTKQRNSISSMT